MDRFARIPADWFRVRYGRCLRRIFSGTVDGDCLQYPHAHRSWDGFHNDCRHRFHGVFWSCGSRRNPVWAVPLAFITIAGGLIGGKFALKTKPRHLKKLFAYTNWLAAVFMVFNAFQANKMI
jgi:hypothetical protein